MFGFLYFYYEMFIQYGSLLANAPFESVRLLQQKTTNKHEIY